MNAVAAHPARVRRESTTASASRVSWWPARSPASRPPAAAPAPPAPWRTARPRPPATPLEYSSSSSSSYLLREPPRWPSFPARWQQVEADFAATGRVAHTAEELAFAARLAWRNSTRCVGRLYWEGLAAARLPPRPPHGEVPCWTAIWGHIEWRLTAAACVPSSTVFPPRESRWRGPRVWSPQLFRYDGRLPRRRRRVLAIRQRPELTDVAIAPISLAAACPRASAFDLLAGWIVQAAAKRPVWRRIRAAPRARISERASQLALVRGSEPEWYACPAV